MTNVPESADSGGRARSSCRLLAGRGWQAARAEEPQFYTKAPVGGTAPSEIKESYSIGPSYMEGAKSKAKIECRKGSGSAVVDGAKSTKEVRIKFAECETPDLMSCENRGNGTKEIETDNLVGELGPIASGKAGLRLKPESGVYLMEYSCAGGAVVIKVKGSLIGEVTGASGNTVEEGKIGASGDLKFAQAKGIQKYTRFVGESSGQQLEDVLKEGGSAEREELQGQNGAVVVRSVPAYNIGETL
jgi:hypothetical protein